MNDKELKRWVESRGLMQRIRVVVVDFTPILPGGENGGAKVFLIELIKKLANSAPNTKFIILTKYLSHDELSVLDSQNIQRVLVVDDKGPIGLRDIVSASAEHFDIPLTEKIIRNLNLKLSNFLKISGKIFSEKSLFRRASNRATRIIQSRISIKPTYSLLKGLKSDILLCPFTATTYSDPAIPCVSIVYDLQYKTYPQFFHSAEVEHRDKIFVDAITHANKIVAISNYTKKSVVEHGRVDEHKIHTIYLRMSQRVLGSTASIDVVLSKFGLSPGKFIIYPANFWPHKNHEFLITAFGIARSIGLEKSFKLVCTGAPGKRSDFLRKVAYRFGLSQYIVFPGYVSDAELSILLSNCAALIFPSLYEGFGLPVLEAMANGIPVACSNVASLPEVVDNAAITFNPKIPKEIASAIIQITNDKVRISRLKEAGRFRADFFADSNQMTREYWELFDLALNDLG